MGTATENNWNWRSLNSHAHTYYRVGMHSKFFEYWVWVRTLTRIMGLLRIKHSTIGSLSSYAHAYYGTILRNVGIGKSNLSSHAHTYYRSKLVSIATTQTTQAMRNRSNKQKAKTISMVLSEPKWDAPLRGGEPNLTWRKLSSRKRLDFSFSFDVFRTER